MSRRVYIGTNDPGKLPGTPGLVVEAKVTHLPTGALVSMTILGDHAVFDLRVALPADAVLAATSKQATCGAAKGGVVTCEIAALRPGQSVAIELVAKDPGVTAVEWPYRLEGKDAAGDTLVGGFDAPVAVKAE